MLWLRQICLSPPFILYCRGVWCPLAVQGVRVAAQKQAPMTNLALSAVVSRKEDKGEVEVEEAKGV